MIYVGRKLGVGVLTTVVLMGGLAVSSMADDGDQDRARAALSRGEIEPLHKALSVVEKRVKGDVIEVELEEENVFASGPTLIYEIKVLTAEGQVVKLKVHAKTLEILTVHGNDADDPSRDD